MHCRFGKGKNRKSSGNMALIHLYRCTTCLFQQRSGLKKGETRQTHREERIQIRVWDYTHLGEEINIEKLLQSLGGLLYGFPYRTCTHLNRNF